MTGLAPLRALLFAPASVDETGGIINVTGYSHLTVYLTGSGTTSSGVVTIEEADVDPATGQVYGGTWSSVATVNASDVNNGATKATHLTVGAYAWLRVRISTVIGGGGTVAASLVATE